MTAAEEVTMRNDETAPSAQEEHVRPHDFSAGSQTEKRRLLLLVRTGLTLAIGYLLIFSSESKQLPLSHLSFVVLYLGSNILIALLPARVLATATFDVALVLADTAATSFALLLIPETNTDVFVFYFAIVLLASISDRATISLMAPVVTSIAYFAFLIARHGMAEVMQPAILLRVPFFLLAGAFYGFFVDRVRRGQIATAAAQQREAARTEFLSLITHDLKQPLWVAQQSAAMLYDQLDRGDDGARALTAQVMVSLRRMEALTLNFLDLGGIESRGIKLFPQRASLNAVVEDLIESYGPAFELEQLRLEVELDQHIGTTSFDPLQLQRALANLVDNAVKFTPEGGTITIRTSAQAGSLRIVVGDSGPGIPAERVATLFTGFQTGRDTTGRRSTGLGLYITAAIVAAHGGTIEIDRERRDGTWFTIELPLRTAEETAPEAESQLPLAAAVPG
jgi:signal transduction histidine kinase